MDGCLGNLQELSVRSDIVVLLIMEARPGLDDSQLAHFWLSKGRPALGELKEIVRVAQ